MYANIAAHGIILIAKFTGDRLKCIANLQSHCANMHFADKSRYERIFKPVTYKRVDPAMNYIKIFQNVQALSVSVGNNYSEDKIMHIFLDIFRQGGKYSSQIASHQADLKREQICTEQNLYLYNPYRLII